MTSRRPVAREVLRELRDLLLPAQCAGCGRWDAVTCRDCVALLRGPADWVPAEGLDGMPVALCTLGPYEGRLRRLVLAAKHAERIDHVGLSIQVGAALAEALHGVLPAGDCAVRVVPAPSTRTRMRTGRCPAATTAHALAARLASITSRPVRVSPLVALSVGARTQAGLSGAQRRAGRSGTMRLDGPAPRAEEVLVLVDDVVTTGATMREMERALGRSADAWAAWADVR